ncbi:hypothetical protein [Pseudanabaena sp. FACHB-2040]|uniref:hypothetical protein n=1 Tax=Pseudanabaena sp. FACHB-2040 TaxID=2692859 RepID=UPI0016847EF6|nr:hypothetical protein [Pseudanabaena sp. FACHB-2040]MBD2257086.1 hypothetical protein [Pseudanabaena sp. FACHB-2040]
MRGLKPVGLFLAAGLAATLVACEGPATDVEEAPEGDLAPTEETVPEAVPEAPGAVPEAPGAVPEAPGGTEGGEGGEGGEG